MANSAPSLDNTASPAFTSIAQGATNPDGITVASLIVDGSIADADGAVESIAIKALNTSLGAWQYSTDGGNTWLTIRADLINSTTNEFALLLSSTDKIRLLPFGNAKGTLSDAITFRAWDQSTGTHGDYVDITAIGGPMAFSIATDTASLTVTAVNSAPSFAPNTAGTGKIVTDIGSSSVDYGQSVTTQADGKLVVAGYSDSGGSYNFAVVRYNADGTLDTSFNAAGTPGKLVTDIASNSLDQGYSVTVQADGKLVVAGSSISGSYFNFAVVRYNADGTLDTSFNAAGTPGKLVTAVGSNSNDYGYSVTVQADGKLVVTGYTGSGGSPNIAVTRYNADGTLDTTFNAAGTPGKLVTDIGSNSSDYGQSVTVQADGKLVVAGRTSSGGSDNFAVVRYNDDGTLDTSFNSAGTPGKLVTDIGSNSNDYGYSVTVQADGKLVVTGYTDSGGSNNFTVVRYNDDGTLDTSFNAAGTPGKLVTDIGSNSNDYGRSVTIQADGKLVVAGYSNSGGSYNFAVVRYNADGTLDTSFNAAGTPGKLVTDIGSNSNDYGYGVTIQADGKLVVAGLTDSGGSVNFAVARYNPDGTLDTTFGATAGSNTLDATPTYNGNGSAVVLDSNVQITDQELSSANNYAGSTLTLARNGGANPQDVFAGSGTLSLSGGDVIVSSTTIGTYTNSAGSLTLNFNGSATQSLVNSALQQITYANTINASGSAEIIWSFNDGSGAGNAIVQGSTVVTLVLSNVAPTVDGSQAGQTATSAQRIQPFKMISVTDSDVGALETATITLDNPLKGSFTPNSMALAGFYTNDGGVSYLHDAVSPAVMQAAIRALVFEPNPSRLALNTSETTTFTIAVQDEHGGTATNNATTVIVSSANMAPTNISLSDAFVAQSEGANATVGLLSATDNNVGDTHTFTLAAASAANDNAKFSIVGNSLKVINPGAMIEKDYYVTVQATDANGLSFMKKLTISLDDDIAPFISSIETLRSPRTTVTTGSFIVKFNENVTGVTLDDFFLSSGSGATAHLSSITALSGNAYRVYIDQIVGTGSLNLNLKTSGTGIADLFGNSLPGAMPPAPPATPVSNEMLVGIHLQQDVFM